MPYRRAMLLLLAFVVVLASPAGAAEPIRVRVLSYNIQHGAGMDGKIDLPRIAAVIQRLAPDVVALQEVDQRTNRSQGVDEAAELGRLTGMHAAYGKAMDFAGGAYGEALLSRVPLTDIQVHQLPFDRGCEPRAAVAAKLRLDNLEFRVVGTHLEHAKASLRLTQATALHAALVKDDVLPTVLAGDFNDTPASPPIKALVKHWGDATADHPAPTWPAVNPRAKIDYVFFRPAAGWRVVEQRVVEEEQASDHRPLFVVLEWSPGR